jgi:thiol-disulfide isomerase/thioredoxin
MKITRRTAYAIGAGVTVLAAGGGYYLYQSQTQKDMEGVYLTAPDFTLPTQDGTPIVLSEVRGDIRIINFWASWNPYSKDELVALVRLKQAHGDDVEIIALNRDTNPHDGYAFLQSIGLSQELTFVFDEQDGYFDQVHGFAAPETLFLDKKGNIIMQQHGPMTYEEMDAQVARMKE